jgi:DnaK suppressor protein
MMAHIRRLQLKREELSLYLQSLSGNLEIDHAAEAEEDAMLALNRESVAGEIRRARRVLAAVDCAIARWKLGEYGRCTACDKRIPAKRLEAIPETPHCLSCAEAHG